MLEQTDDMFLRYRWFTDTAGTLPTMPSRVFHRNFWATFMIDTVGIELRHRLNLDHLLWSTDYPHTGTDWPNSRVTIARALPRRAGRRGPADAARQLSRAVSTRPRPGTLAGLTRWTGAWPAGSPSSPAPDRASGGRSRSVSPRRAPPSSWPAGAWRGSTKPLLRSPGWVAAPARRCAMSPMPARCTRWSTRRRPPSAASTRSSTMP